MKEETDLGCKHSEGRNYGLFFTAYALSPSVNGLTKHSDVQDNMNSGETAHFESPGSTSTFCVTSDNTFLLRALRGLTG